MSTPVAAPAATLVAWLAIDRIRTGKTTAVGCATAIVVGLVAITPAAGFVGPLPALLIGAIAAVPSYFAIEWRVRTRLDDSLDGRTIGRAVIASRRIQIDQVQPPRPGLLPPFGKFHRIITNMERLRALRDELERRGLRDVAEDLRRRGTIP